ncbi:MAG: hypothetical protein HFG44_08865 [Oscillospiraceae bacterium]|nr:hypothetical protein [Oscillospiraceae bacterium]
MSKEFYIRTLTAGRYCKVVRYKRSIPSDGNIARNKKRAATTKAQQFINCKNATEKLEMLLCANFDSKESYFCTLTFDESHLPATRKEAIQVVSGYLRELRQEWTRHGRQLKYIYIVEGESLASSPTARSVDNVSWEITPWKNREYWEMLDIPRTTGKHEPSKRFHVHMFLLLQKKDCEVVRAMWTSGHIYINQMKVNETASFQRIAAYVTKEKRNNKMPNGARGYIPSKNLTQPVSEGHWCSECETIEPPRGAEVILSGREDTFYSSYQYCYYRLPRPQQPPKPYKRKGNVNRTSGKLTRI